MLKLLMMTVSSKMCAYSRYN